MAAEKEAVAAAPPPVAKVGLGANKVPLIMALVNLVVLLGAGGVLFYTRFMYKRPPITEAGERDRIDKQFEDSVHESTASLVSFEPMTVNIGSNPAQPKPADGTSSQLHGKLHYVYLAFALEVKDRSRVMEIEGMRPLVLDKILSVLGRKKYYELNTIQGRYLLRTQIIDLVNELADKKKIGTQDGKSSLVTNVFFSQFIVQ